MTIPQRSGSLLVDLTDLATEEVEVLAQQGGRGMPVFAASTCGPPGSAGLSCAVDTDSQAAQSR